MKSKWLLDNALPLESISSATMPALYIPVVKLPELVQVTVPVFELMAKPAGFTPPPNSSLFATRKRSLSALASVAPTSNEKLVNVVTPSDCSLGTS